LEDPEHLEYKKKKYIYIYAFSDFIPPIQE